MLRKLENVTYFFISNPKAEIRFEMITTSGLKVVKTNINIVNKRL